MRSIRNLKEETESELQDHCYDALRVVHVIASNGTEYMSYDEFLKMADFDYDCGYGGTVVREDIEIVMDDGTWFARAEYDGSEWWEHHRVNQALKGATLITKLKEDY